MKNKFITFGFGSWFILGLVVLPILVFTGCENNQKAQREQFPNVGPRVVVPEEKEVVITKVTPPKLRFNLEKVQTFGDTDAYGNIRNIYILTDSETGKEYIGISGIGIVEMGYHISSKNNVPDER